MSGIKILSYNCNKGNCKFGEIGDIIKTVNADIICLQEYGQIVAQHLESYKLEDSYVFITSPIYQGWSGNVIYSKLPIIKSRFLELEGKARKTPVITVETLNGNLTIACIHLDPGRNANNMNIRETQYKSLLKKLHNIDIIIGDFNMSVNEIPWPPEGWSGTKLIPTYTSDNICNNSTIKFGHPFDRCLYKNLIIENFELVGVNNPASDHYGIEITFKFPIIQKKNNYYILMDDRLLKLLSNRLNGAWIVGVDKTWLDKPVKL